MKRQICFCFSLKKKESWPISEPTEDVVRDLLMAMKEFSGLALSVTRDGKKFIADILFSENHKEILEIPRGKITGFLQEKLPDFIVTVKPDEHSKGGGS